MNDTTRTQFLQPILDAMQRAEEMGGPEGDEYLSLMSEVRIEATKRWSIYSATQPLALPGDLTDVEYRNEAAFQHGSDDLEIDEDAIVSRSGDEDQDGAFVQAWVWVWVSHHRDEEEPTDERETNS